jgi:transcriptional antiterminator RfaH
VTTDNWYVVRTEPRAEFLAAGELAKDGFEVFFPRIKADHPRLGHTDIPFFPGYLFLRCEPDGAGWPIFRPAHRVLGWLSFENEIPWLSDAEVSLLKERSMELNHEGGLWRRFHAGEKVSISSNGIQGLAEVVEDTKSPDSRVKVLLEFMGRLVSAQVPWQSVQPVGENRQDPSKHSRRTRGRGRWVQGSGPRAAIA